MMFSSCDGVFSTATWKSILEGPWLKALLVDCVVISIGVQQAVVMCMRFQRTRGPSFLLELGEQWDILGFFLSEWNTEISTMVCLEQRGLRSLGLRWFSLNSLAGLCLWYSLLSECGETEDILQDWLLPSLSFLSGSFILSYWNFLSEYKRRFLKFIELMWRFGAQLIFFPFGITESLISIHIYFMTNAWTLANLGIGKLSFERCNKVTRPNWTKLATVKNQPS